MRDHHDLPTFSKRDFPEPSCSLTPILGGLRASYRAYRHTASKVKLLFLGPLSLCLISNTWAWVSLEQIHSIYRLRGPAAGRPLVTVTSSPSQGGRCRGNATL